MTRTLLALVVAAIISIAAHETSNAAPIAPLQAAASQSETSGVTDVGYRTHHWHHPYAYRPYYSYYPSYYWYPGWRWRWSWW
jgi:hypothetical protein